MVGVRGHSVAGDFGEDVSPALAGELQLLEYKDGAALAYDEAVALGVEGTAGAAGIVVAGRKGAAGGESADAHRRDGGFGAPGEHGVGVAAADDLGGVSDGMGARSAGGYDAAIRTTEAEADGDLAAGHVADHHRNEERADAIDALLHARFDLALQRSDAADAGADEHADTVAVFVRDFKAAVVHRLLGGGDGELREAIHLASFFFVAPLMGIEVLDLGPKRDGIARSIKEGEGRDAALPGKDGLPTLFRPMRHRGDGPEAGDDHSPGHTLCPLRPWLRAIVPGRL
jgi:hypothetical protein